MLLEQYNNKIINSITIAMSISFVVRSSFYVFIIIIFIFIYQSIKQSVNELRQLLNEK